MANRQIKCIFKIAYPLIIFFPAISCQHSLKQPDFKVVSDPIEAEFWC
jgi:hypothetical protein